MFFATPARSYAPTVRAFDRSLERFIDQAFAATTQPGYQVTQDDKAYTVQLDVPGLTKEQLSIGIEGHVVRINSKEDAPRQVKAAYELPLDIDASASDARLEHGVLTLTLAKKVPLSNMMPLTIN